MIAPRQPRSSQVVLVTAISAALFADSLLYSAVVPVLPSYAGRLGAGPVAIGLLFASYAIALLVATPALASVSDRYGRRGPILFGMAGVTAATLTFAAADSYAMLLVARSLQGVAAAAVWTSGIALLADRIEPGRLGAAMGTVMASMSAGLLLGPPMAGFIAEAAGFRAVFVTAAALTAAAGLLQLLPTPAQVQQQPATTFRQLLGARLYRTLAAVSLAAAALSLLEPTLPLELNRRFDAGPATIGLAFGAATLAHLLAAPAVGLLSDRTSRPRLIRLGMAGTGLVLPFVVAPGSTVGVGAVLVMFALAYSFVLIPALPELAAIVRDSSAGYAAVYAAFNISYSIGMVIGPIAGTLAIAQWNTGSTLAVTGGLLLATALVMGIAPCTRTPLVISGTRPSPL